MLTSIPSPAKDEAVRYFLELINEKGVITKRDYFELVEVVQEAKEEHEEMQQGKEITDFDLIESLREVYRKIENKTNSSQKQYLCNFFEEYYPNEQILRKLQERKHIFWGSNGFDLLVEIISEVDKAKKEGTCIHVYTIGSKKGQHCVHRPKNHPDYCCFHTSKAHQLTKEYMNNYRSNPEQVLKERKYIHQKRMEGYNK